MKKLNKIVLISIVSFLATVAQAQQIQGAELSNLALNTANELGKYLALSYLSAEFEHRAAAHLPGALTCNSRTYEHDKNDTDEKVQDEMHEIRQELVKATVATVYHQHGETMTTFMSARFPYVYRLDILRNDKIKTITEVHFEKFELNNPKRLISDDNFVLMSTENEIFVAAKDTKEILPIVTTEHASDCVNDLSGLQ